MILEMKRNADNGLSSSDPGLEVGVGVEVEEEVEVEVGECEGTWEVSLPPCCLSVLLLLERAHECQPLKCLDQTAASWRKKHTCSNPSVYSCRINNKTK